MSEKESQLSERKKQILKAIVEAHIAAGEPVGSKSILENRQLSCSSATIRNEMVELEAMGYLEQPHTSAGRVPSELGYRFYVDSLVEHYVMTAKEVTAINSLLKSKMAELDQVLTTASRLASSMTNYMGFALKPKSESTSVKRFETVYIDDFNFVLVMVLPSGSVKTKSVHLPFPVSAETVQKLGKALNAHLCGLPVNGITLSAVMAMENEMGDDAAVVSPVMKMIYGVMNEADSEDMRTSGVNQLLQYPEYSDVNELQQLLGAIENKQEILDLVSENQKDDGTVLIGSETSVKVLNNSTLVFRPIKQQGKTVGAVGVIGPVRMDYAKVLATLEGISDNISSILNDNQLDGGSSNGG